MAKQIWVVVQLRDGQVSRISWEAIGAAQRLAGQLGGKAEAVVLGSGVAAAAAEIGKLDLAAVHVADHEALRVYTPGGWIGALAPAIRAAQPAFVVFPHTYQSVDFVPRLAQATGAGLLPEVTGFASGSRRKVIWTRPILGGKMQAKVRVKGEGTVLVSVQSGAFPADAVVKGEKGEAPVQALAVDLSGLQPDREILGYEEVGGDQVDLTKADIILAVGRGVGGADKMGAGRGSGQGPRRRDRRQPAGDRQRLAAARPPDRLLGPDRRAQALHRRRHLRRHPASGGNEGLDHRGRDQQGPRRADLLGRPLRDRRRPSRDPAGADRGGEGGQGVRQGGGSAVRNVPGAHAPGYMLLPLRGTPPPSSCIGLRSSSGPRPGGRKV